MTCNASKHQALLDVIDNKMFIIMLMKAVKLSQFIRIAWNTIKVFFIKAYTL